MRTPTLSVGSVATSERWPRELLAILVVAPPVLFLVFEPEGMTQDFAHHSRSLLAVWIYVMALGYAIQVFTDAMLRWRPSSLGGIAGALRHLGGTSVLVLAVTVVAAKPAAMVCSDLIGHSFLLFSRGLILSLVYVIAGRFYWQTQKARAESAQQKAVVAQQLAEAKYSALMTRTQPHFLHNALTAAAGLVPTDPNEAERVLRELGALFREVVKGSEQRNVRVADEVATAAHYLHIQGVRFGARLKCEIDADPLAAEEIVPALVLLPFVENAVLHGLSDGGETMIRVQTRLERDHVRFVIEDNGPGKSTQHQEGTGIGAADVRARLQTLFGSNATVKNMPKNEGAARPGYVVELRIPRGEE